MTKLKKEKTGRLAQTGFLSSEATGTARWSRCLCGKVYDDCIFSGLRQEKLEKRRVAIRKGGE